MVAKTTIWFLVIEQTKKIKFNINMATFYCFWRIIFQHMQLFFFNIYPLTLGAKTSTFLVAENPAVSGNNKKQRTLL